MFDPDLFNRPSHEESRTAKQALCTLANLGIFEAQREREFKRILDSARESDTDELKLAKQIIEYRKLEVKYLQLESLAKKFQQEQDPQ